MDETDFSKGESYLAKLKCVGPRMCPVVVITPRRSNFVGTHFTIFDNGVNPSKISDSHERERRELAAVVYVCLAGRAT
jgi:hypothetical protein